MKSVNALPLRWFLLILVLLMAVAGVGFWWQDAVSPVDSADQAPVIFVIQRGEGVKSIAAKLAQQQLIRSPIGFFLLVKILGIETQLQAGDYRLNRTMTATTIARELTHGMLDVWVTTLEGWRDEEIANKLAKALDIPEAEFLKYAQEGYMFPDTYLVPREATAAAIVQIFLGNFNKKVTPQIRSDAGRSGLTFEEIITLASIVEREGRTVKDRPIIAGILLKRLRSGWPLQTDATLQYALGYQSQEKSWWKSVITADDQKIRSGYNTYLIAGLPPAPIANPGLESIQTVIYPQETNYWYYLHDTTGAVHYATTIEEHDANISKYLNQ